MTTRDPDGLIHAFLMEGAEDLPDAVYDAVRADIDQKRQRVVIGPWRMPTVNKLIPIGLGAGAAVVALVLATQWLPRQPSGVGGAGSPAPSPSASTRPSAAAVSPSPSTAAGLPDGRFVLQNGTIEGVREPGVPVTITIAARGWLSDPNSGIIVKNGNSDPPNGAGMIVFNDGHGWFVPSDPCTWSTTVPSKRPTTVAEQITALAAQGSREPSAPEDITVGGHPGKAITLHVPDDAAFNGCDQGKFCTLADPELSPSDACFRWQQGPGQIDHVWVIDVDGRLVILDWADYDGTPAQDTAELEAMAQSSVFE